MAVAEIKDEVIVANVKKINRIERMITVIIIKKIVIVIIVVVGDMTTGDVISFNVAENRVKTEIIVTAIEILMSFTGAGIY